MGPTAGASTALGVWEEEPLKKRAAPGSQADILTPANLTQPWLLMSFLSRWPPEAKTLEIECIDSAESTRGNRARKSPGWRTRGPGRASSIEGFGPRTFETQFFRLLKHRV
jgi:hypothetical protein